MAVFRYVAGTIVSKLTTWAQVCLLEMSLPVLGLYQGFAVSYWFQNFHEGTFVHRRLPNCCCGGIQVGTSYSATFHLKEILIYHITRSKQKMTRAIVSNMYLITFQSLLHMVVCCVRGGERSRLSNWRSTYLIYTSTSADRWTHQYNWYTITNEVFCRSLNSLLINIKLMFYPPRNSLLPLIPIDVNANTINSSTYGTVLQWLSVRLVLPPTP